MSSCLRPVVLGMVLAGMPVSAIHAAEAGDQKYGNHGDHSVRV